MSLLDRVLAGAVAGAFLVAGFVAGWAAQTRTVAATQALAHEWRVTADTFAALAATHETPCWLVPRDTARRHP